jgi:hypothetical protein
VRDDQDKTRDGGDEPERRAAPRAPISGLHVVGRDRSGPLVSRRFEVRDAGLETLFISGPDAARCSVGQEYRLRLVYQEQSVDCAAECVRLESSPRVGAVLRLLAGEQEARKLLAGVLKPSKIPLRRRRGQGKKPSG